MNQEDFITINIPLLIRLLEWAHEECKSDIEIHDLVQNAIKLSLHNDKLEMDSYENLLNFSQLEEDFSKVSKGFRVDKKTEDVYITTSDGREVKFPFTTNPQYQEFIIGNKYKKANLLMGQLVHKILSSPTAAFDAIPALRKQIDYVLRTY